MVANPKTIAYTPYSCGPSTRIVTTAVASVNTALTT